MNGKFLTVSMPSRSPFDSAQDEPEFFSGIIFDDRDATRIIRSRVGVGFHWLARRRVLFFRLFDGEHGEVRRD